MFVTTFSCSAQMASWQHEENEFIFVTSFSISDPGYPWTHSSKQNKKALLTTGTYFKVSTPASCRDNEQIIY